MKKKVVNYWDYNFLGGLSHEVSQKYADRPIRQANYIKISTESIVRGLMGGNEGIHKINKDATLNG